MLGEEVGEVGDEVLDHWLVRRRQLRIEPLMSPMSLVQASMLTPSIFIAQEPQMPSRQERRKVEHEIDLVLDPDEPIQDHRPAIIEIDRKRVEARVLSGLPDSSDRCGITRKFCAPGGVR